MFLLSIHLTGLLSRGCIESNMLPPLPQFSSRSFHLHQPIKSLHMFTFISFCSGDNVFGAICKQTLCIFKSWQTMLWTLLCEILSYKAITSIVTCLRAHTISWTCSTFSSEVDEAGRFTFDVWVTSTKMLMSLVHSHFFMVLFPCAFISFLSISEGDFLRKT